ncbi:MULTISPECIES: CPBP family intramembrane glutamic endopeptidase [unclassified Rhodococcus (in: high G+C Gram-positive bacteria)]|uniref:CPBP family intramembrane glutamic endopeptidase n=1 Tax=unclassified Rhodococcus (in: high G+C Gram-positive bacteria) TaxID=192944 RepID=UPI00211ADD4B|nr:MULTISPECIES: CPBP family intramembrane glutamic endopeptidase [unclassified Rhodococcus (in: high G+C Gram-positive bacteria)]
MRTALTAGVEPAGRPVLTGLATTAWSTYILPALGLDARRRAVANASFAVGVAALSRTSAAELGLRNTAAGLKWGAAAAAVPVLGSTVVAAVPALRRRVRPSEDELAEWVLFRIPVGTVVTEELLFRGVLDAASPALSPIFFGLWHIHPARAAGDTVLGTVAATAAAGVVFSWLRARSGSVLAPALLHYFLNASGAVLAHLASVDEERG